MARTLVCALDVAPLRAAPAEDAERVTEALCGEPLTIEERRAGWVLVRTAYDYPGWIAADALADTALAGWLRAPRAGDPVDEARSYLGTPYLWGGMSARGIDCSGLVHMAYRQLGRLVPRDADQQEDAAEAVAEPRRGDLVTYGSTSATHIAFWLDGGRILHAPGGRTVVEELEPTSLRRRRRQFVRLPLA